MLAVLDVGARGVDADGVVRVHQLREEVKSAAAAAAGLEQSLTVHVFETAGLDDCELVHLEAEAIEVIPQLAEHAMLHESEALEIVFVEGRVTRIDD